MGLPWTDSEGRVWKVDTLPTSGDVEMSDCLEQPLPGKYICSTILVMDGRLMVSGMPAPVDAVEHALAIWRAGRHD